LWASEKIGISRIFANSGAKVRPILGRQLDEVATLEWADDRVIGLAVQPLLFACPGLRKLLKGLGGDQDPDWPPLIFNDHRTIEGLLESEVETEASIGKTQSGHTGTLT
jgi:hypothetical protein